MPFQQGALLDPVRIEISLKRLIEVNRKVILDKTYIYPFYTIIINEKYFMEYEPFLNRFKEVLEGNIEAWLREKGYERIHPITICFKKGPVANQPFEINISKKTLVAQAFLLDVKTGVSFPFNAGVTVVGRGRDCHIRIVDDTVSQNHAQVDCQSGKHILTDLGSRNGTRVNKKKISTICIQRGDEVAFGRVVCLFQVENRYKT